MEKDTFLDMGSGNGSWLPANASTVSPWSGEEDEEFMEDYEYDLEQAMGFFDWWELVPTLAVYAITMLLGVAGNALIIFTTARYRRMKSTTNVFLCSLASADLLLLLICIPVKILNSPWGAMFLSVARSPFQYSPSTLLPLEGGEAGRERRGGATGAVNYAILIKRCHLNRKEDNGGLCFSGNCFLRCSITHFAAAAVPR